MRKATHDRGGRARRGQAAHIHDREAGAATLRYRLSRPIGEKGSRRAPGGYRSKGEWFQKSRRLAALESRLAREKADREAGAVHVVRGGRRLLGTRHNLHAAQLTGAEWRGRWDARRLLLPAGGAHRGTHRNDTSLATTE